MAKNGVMDGERPAVTEVDEKEGGLCPSPSSSNIPLDPDHNIHWITFLDTK
jgi:hypothetical protein